MCIHVFNLSSSLCSPLIAPSVTVFATNILGDGEVSDEFTFGQCLTLIIDAMVIISVTCTL